MKPTRTWENVVDRDAAEHRFSWWDEDGASAFGRAATLDPGTVVSVWERLSRDTLALQFASVPHVMHRALLNTLRERIAGK